MTRNKDAEPVRIGLIGCGFLGGVLGESFAAAERSTVVALTEVDAKRRRTVGTDLGVDSAHQYSDYEAMLDGEQLDAVSIATPHTLHYDQIVAAMDRELDVLCEKPLTTDLDDAVDLAERADEDGPTLMVGYQRHLNPAFERARDRWADTKAEPTFATAEITQHWADRFEDAWRTDPDLSGGGYLYDTGSHILDALCWTMGLDPSWVEAEMDFIDEDQRVDSRAIVTIRFENGATATVSVFGDAPATREHIHIWDDDGAVYLEGREWEPRRYSEIESDSTTRTPYVREGERDKVEAFLDAIESGEQPPATAEDALVVTAVTEAAYESARTGERVAVEW
ncbi:MAG: Gfo/Idh/MocA family protein [Halapricum sp.]